MYFLFSLLLRSSKKDLVIRSYKSLGFVLFKTVTFSLDLSSILVNILFLVFVSKTFHWTDVKTVETSPPGTVCVSVIGVFIVVVP